MSAVEVWIVIGLLAFATVLTRGTLFLLGRAVRLTPSVVHALRYAPAAALAAIIAPDFLMRGNMLDLSWTNPKLLAGLAATLFFLWSRHLLGTILIGMLIFSLLRITIQS